MILLIFFKRQQAKLLRYLLILSLGLILSCIWHRNGVATSNLIYEKFEQPNSIIHTVTIPYNSNYIITPLIAQELASIEQFTTQHKAIAAINGGYFDPQNQKTTSYITKNNNLIADPRTNERLIDNPSLKPYLGKILNRGEFRRYQCGTSIFYDIAPHFSTSPDGCILQDALGAGPQLLPLDTSLTEGFIAYQDNKLVRDVIGANALNSRSAVAIKDGGEVILAMVEQKAPVDSGMSLPNLTAFLQGLGAVKAINLDGGSSSSLYYQGQTYYGKLDKEGNKVQRPIKSVLAVITQHSKVKS